MSEGHESRQSPDSASLRIDATPEAIYALVTNVAGMGRLSPECTGGSWLDGATGPVVGAKFKGTNKRGIARWSTTNTVVTADPGKAFAFETKDSGTRWTYTMEPEGDATLVTESRAAFAERPLLARVFSKIFLGGVEDHDEEMRQGLVQTLERLKQVAEAG